MKSLNGATLVDIKLKVLSQTCFTGFTREHLGCIWK